VCGARSRRLEGFEHLGEDSLAVTCGGHRDNGSGADIELDPGTAIALQLDELEEGSCRADPPIPCKSFREQQEDREDDDGAERGRDRCAARSAGVLATAFSE